MSFDATWCWWEFTEFPVFRGQLPLYVVMHGHLSSIIRGLPNYATRLGKSSCKMIHISPHLELL